jgi:ppGpp synthetase/RelA/SpoT-type nucleotidyltranferase
MSDIIQQYRELKPKFERLKNNIDSVLKQILSERSIPVFAIETRLKDEASLSSKIARKSYGSALDEIDDLCGVRVICYYQEDISNICGIVDDEFEIIRRENKKEALHDDQFGYASYHYVVTLRKEWFAHASARGLEGMRAEIQIRTMLMHTWSAISHKLLYKREADVPPQFKRQLNRLSALIELADEQFDSIKNIKIKLIDDLSGAEQDPGISAELTSDSLMALYNRYFIGRINSEYDIPDLIEEIRLAGYDLQQLVKKIELCLPFLDDMEREEFSNTNSTPPVWAFSGAIRTILDLVSDEYYESRASSMPSFTCEIRDKYKEIIFKAEK